MFSLTINFQIAAAFVAVPVATFVVVAVVHRVVDSADEARLEVVAVLVADAVVECEVARKCTSSSIVIQVRYVIKWIHSCVEELFVAGVFLAKGKEDALVTLNLVPGDSVYGEKRISIDEENDKKVEYRVWNPFRSKLAASIMGGRHSITSIAHGFDYFSKSDTFSGLEDIYMPPGSKVLYLGAASGTTVSHVADIVGPVRLTTTFCESGISCLCFRKEWFTRLNSVIAPAVTC